MIHVESLSKIFETGRGKHVNAVAGASFSVAAGEIFGILGPNGAGKTTLLRMLGTIIRPTSGTCTIDGVRGDLHPEQARRSIGFLSGNTRLYGRLSAREVLVYFGRLYGMEDDALMTRVGELAALLDMRAFMDRRCHALSTGQIQKVSIARVLLHDPPVLILDEPTLGLDIMTSRTILDFISSARDRGRCIIFSTHYMTEAELLCDRVGFLYEGRLLAIGTKPELYAATNSGNLQGAFLAFVDRASRSTDVHV
jgi:sodium transport system ATP-binding protein